MIEQLLVAADQVDYVVIAIPGAVAIALVGGLAYRARQKWRTKPPAKKE